MWLSRGCANAAAARPDPAVTIARLTERNRALRRELGVAQRLMTGYHAQLMTGGAAFTFTELTEPTEVEAQSRNAPFGGAARAPPPAYAARRFSRRPFEAPRVVSRSRMQFQSGPREPLAPAHQGVVMDTWTDIVLGSAGNLNGSVDTTDCYCGADCCYGVLQSRMQFGLLSRDGFSDELERAADYRH